MSEIPFDQDTPDPDPDPEEPSHPPTTPDDDGDEMDIGR
jgi:hypothetical protein